MMEVSVNREKGYHYLECPLGRYPKWREVLPIKDYLIKYGAKHCKKTAHEMHFRYSQGEERSLHIIIKRNSQGFSVNAHIDVIPHETAVYDDTTYLLLRDLDKLFSENISLSAIVKRAPKKVEPEKTTPRGNNQTYAPEIPKGTHQFCPHVPPPFQRKKKRRRHPKDKIISYLYSPVLPESGSSRPPQSQPKEPPKVPDSIDPLLDRLRTNIADRKKRMIREVNSSLAVVALAKIPEISVLKKELNERKNNFLSIKETTERKRINSEILAHLSQAFPRHRRNQYLRQVLKRKCIQLVHTMVKEFRAEVTQLCEAHWQGVRKKHGEKIEQERVRRLQEEQRKKDARQESIKNREDELRACKYKEKLRMLGVRKKHLYLYLVPALICTFGLYSTWPFGIEVNLSDAYYYAGEIEFLIRSILFLLCILGAVGLLGHFFGQFSKVRSAIGKYRAKYESLISNIRGREVRS